LANGTDAVAKSVGGGRTAGPIATLFSPDAHE
jgi:hypothetical protein